jgi:two-component system, OmpR family, sensor histidine kinase KdpD
LMLGDAGAVRRLVLNLLDNAQKHTAAGSIRLTVRRHRDEHGQAWADIEVADTGAGIPPEIVERLGQAFLLNAGLVGDRHITGAGLGLAICKGIVHAHGGHLRVRSVVGAGTVVTATLRADLPAPTPGSGSVAPALQELPAELPAT